MSDSHCWWKHGVIYQVFVRSFQDSDGDGVGDLPGILSRLDHLSWLGVDAIWISPFYPSPMADLGYDVADYCAVDERFGTMDGFDRLLEAAHARGLRVILDFVPNHTSDRHPWFLESRASRDSARREWYIWRDPGPDGKEPNNWCSVFGGSAWEWDPETGQYYYHAFLKEQPDLNCRNPAVEAALLDAMRFWLERGVDGFRVDVMWHLIKDPLLRDNPPNPDYSPDQPPNDRFLPVFSTDQPEVHDIVSRMREVLDSYGDTVMIGELYLPIGRLVAYYGQGGSGAHLPSNFQLLQVGWSAEEVYSSISEYEGALPVSGWPNWIISNHDKSRIASRVGRDGARIAAMLLLTLRGTPTIYYGDELGMQDVPVPPDRIQDPQGRLLGPRFNRDPQRAPVPWNAERYAGFTTGDPWLSLPRDHARIHAEVQREDPDSMLHLYRRLLELRRGEPALRKGAYIPVGVQGKIMAYIRDWEGDRLLVVVNLGRGPGLFARDRHDLRGEVVLGTERAREGEAVDGAIELAGSEGVIVRLDA